MMLIIQPTLGESALTRGGTYNDFNGYIDEVKIYPYARTPQEIRMDFAAGQAGIKSNHGVSAAFGSASDSWLTDGLVGYWKMDESATTSGAIDSSGNGNTGTYYGDASTTAGKFGNGAIFNGNDSVEADSIGIYNEYTLSAWVNIAEDQTSVNRIIDYGGRMGALVFEANSSKVYYYLYDGEHEDSLACELSDNIWHLIIGTLANNEMNFYVDGILIDTKKINGSLSTGDSNVFIGSENNTSYYFDGQIDEVRIYNRALSPDEVRKLYEWAPGPVLHLKFDEKSGTTTYDSSGYGNDGTIYGVSWTRGKYGGALSFDGTNNDYVNYGNDSSLNLYNLNYTIGAWIYLEEYNPDWASVIWGRGYTNCGLDFKIEGPPSTNPYKIGIHHFDNYDASESAFSNSNVSLNQWHYVAMVYNLTSGIVYFYLDGKPDGSSTIDPMVDCGSRNAYSGIDVRDLDKLNFKGLIDELRVYNYARTQKQILADYANAPSSQGGNVLVPVLDLHFDEGYGATAHDSSIHGNDGALNSGGSGDNDTTAKMWDLNGKSGKAMEFDSTNDYINCGSDSSLDNIFDGGGSFSAWIYLNSWGESDISRLAVKASDLTGSNGWMLSINDNYSPKKSLMFEDHFDTGQGGWITPANSLSLGQWQHVVVVYNSDSDTNDPKIYINKKLIETTETDSNSGTRRSDAAYNLYFGSYLGNNTVDGLVDEVKIYNYALDEDEVKTLYNQGQAAVMGSVSTATSTNAQGQIVHVPSNAASQKYCVPGSTDYCAPPVLELKFDEKQGSTAYDTSGNGNNGTINGATWARGKFGSALEFDGVDDDVNFSTITFNNAFTISSWAYFLNDQTAIVVGRNSGVPTDRIERYNSFLFYEIADNGVVDTGFDLDKNKWYYITLVRDNNDYVKVYVDGKLEFSSTATSSGVSYWDSIGDYNDAYHINGLIDQVRIYDYARTPAQIAWEYNRGKPIAEWRFDECSGGTIHDESYNCKNNKDCNNGVLHLGTSGVTATGTCASSSNSFWYNGRNGKYNSAGSFDETDDYVKVSSLDLSGTDAVSLSFWFKHNYENSNSTTFELTDDFNSYTTGFGFFPDDNYECKNYIMMAINGDSGYNKACFKRPSSSIWHYFVAIYDI